MPQNYSQEMRNNVRFRFSVGDTTWVVSNKHRSRQIESVTLNPILSVVPIYCLIPTCLE